MAADNFRYNPYEGPQEGPRNNPMYELEYPSPEVKETEQGGPTLVVALQGYADAGQAVEASADHLTAALDNRLLASFDIDELIDYRSRRPAVTIENHDVSDIEDLELTIRVLRDSTGKSFLLLSGPEPDLRWGAFTRAVADLVDRFGVQRTVCLYSAPMTVPHTRPLVVSAHGNTPELVAPHFSFDGQAILPGSAALQLEKVLSRRGRKIAGYTAHVPHYVAASPYPEATLGLLRTVSRSAGLEFPLGALERDRTRVAEQLAQQMDDSVEIQHVVHSLEQQYDEEVENYRQNHPRSALPGEPSTGVGSEAVPSSEEIGEEFEKFLASLDDSTADGSRDPDEDTPGNDEDGNEGFHTPSS